LIPFFYFGFKDTFTFDVKDNDYSYVTVHYVEFKKEIVIVKIMV